MTRITHAPQRGFSLIELSAILTIAAILAVTYLQWLQSRSTEDANAIVATNQKMRIIEDAVLDFITTHHRLPCPMNPLTREDNTLSSGGTSTYKFGWERMSHSTSSPYQTCASPIGSVPVYALGLDARYLLDGWNRRFTFHVSPARCNDRTADAIGCSPEDYANNGVLLAVNDAYDLSILDNENTFPSPVNALFVIVSHGSNGLGAYTPAGIQMTTPNAATEADEFNNTDGYTTASTTSAHVEYVLRSTQSGFDDTIRYVTQDAIRLYTSQRHPISIAFCNSNANAIQNLTVTNINNMDTTINDYSFTAAGGTTVNQGGEVIFDLLWTMQNICIDDSYYGSNANGSWLGQLCPGGGSIGSVCDCSDGSWDGTC